LAVSLLATLPLLAGCSTSRTSTDSPASTEVAASTAAEAVTQEQVTFRGWDALKLSNGTAEVIVVPSIGRIMYFGPVGGTEASNALWVNGDVAGQMPADDGWTNFGGDKAWPWPQNDAGGWDDVFGAGNWPPPRTFDGDPWQGQFQDGAIVYSGPESIEYRVRPIREVRLEPDGMALTVTTRFLDTAQQRESADAGVWHVTQIPRAGNLVVATGVGGIKWMGTADDPDQLFGEMAQTLGGGDYVITPLAKSGKVGLDTDVLATGVDLDGNPFAFVQQLTEAGPDATAAYLDTKDKAQVFITDFDGDNAASDYVELEFSAPVGAASFMTIRWELVPLDTDLGDAQALLSATKAAAE
jgi:hypothetical protein